MIYEINQYVLDPKELSKVNNFSISIMTGNYEMFRFFSPHRTPVMKGLKTFLQEIN